MTPRMKRKQPGATLVELLVVMSIVAALGALALMLLPGITNTDNTLKGTAEVQSTLRVSQGMAGAARMPRGVRFIVGTNPGYPWIATEMQYLEAPPVMVPDPLVLVDKTNSYGVDTGNGPRLEFLYELAGPQMQPTDPPPGTIIARHCYIIGLNADQATQVADGSVVVLPTVNAWSRVLGTPVDVTQPGGQFTLEVVLDVYPDMLMGASTALRTYHFAVYGPPVPLIGEPTVLMPKNIGVDLEMSVPRFGAPPQNFDIMFAPSGQTVTGGSVDANASIFLWIRDYTKVGSMHPSAYGGQNATWASQFRYGGEQQIVGIRNGFVGTAPVLWPNDDGSFSNNEDLFSLARRRLN